MVQICTIIDGFKKILKRSIFVLWKLYGYEVTLNEVANPVAKTIWLPIRLEERLDDQSKRFSLLVAP
ncbi:hypothetical protein C2869_02625 [Saccharobesus litoralis]|uniref:Uncharacterized protein n=1 Tax=Saccharobesus litoralis TaxID=2172099 RepID=A0A2S0VMJ2_9ALTE|nr:hypothetical protein C2869_02625 [Saccharobesus litoralis]